MFSPGSPFPFYLGLNIVNKDFCGSHGVWIVVDFITETNNRLVILKPCYFLDMIGFYVI